MKRSTTSLNQLEKVTIPLYLRGMWKNLRASQITKKNMIFKNQRNRKLKSYLCNINRSLIKSSIALHTICWNKNNNIKILYPCIKVTGSMSVCVVLVNYQSKHFYKSFFLSLYLDNKKAKCKWKPNSYVVRHEK